MKEKGREKKGKQGKGGKEGNRGKGRALVRLVFMNFCFVLLHSRSPTETVFKEKTVKKKVTNQIEIARHKERMTMQRKAQGKECKDRRTKQQVFQERGFMIRFPASFPK